MESIHVGDPPSDFSCWETKMVYIHDFLDYSDANGDDNVVHSPEFRCFGHQWQVDVYPGGDSESSEDGYVSIYLSNLSSSEVTLDWKMSLMRRDDCPKCIINHQEEKFAKGENFADDGSSASSFIVSEDCHTIGDPDAVRRVYLLGRSSNYLHNGSLVIKVQMRLSADRYICAIYPRNSSFNYASILGDKTTSDISFNVGGRLFFAHKCIIKAHANDFYTMCEEYTKESPMVINDVDENIFDIMINSLYGEDVFPDEWRAHSESILNATSKYGFAALKSEAEKWHANSLKFTVDNVVDELRKADGNNHDVVKAALLRNLSSNTEKKLWHLKLSQSCINRCHS